MLWNTLEGFSTWIRVSCFKDLTSGTFQNGDGYENRRVCYNSIFSQFWYLEKVQFIESIEILIHNHVFKNIKTLISGCNLQEGPLAGHEALSLAPASGIGRPNISRSVDCSWYGFLTIIKDFVRILFLWRTYLGLSPFLGLGRRPSNGSYLSHPVHCRMQYEDLCLMKACPGLWALHESCSSILYTSRCM